MLYVCLGSIGLIVAPWKFDVIKTSIFAFSSPEPSILLTCGRNRELWEQPFWKNKGNNRILPIRFHCAVCIYGACLKWLLPELSFSDLWSRGTKTLGTRLLTSWKGHSQLAHLRIRYQFIANLHITDTILFLTKYNKNNIIHVTEKKKAHSKTGFSLNDWRSKIQDVFWFQGGWTLSKIRKLVYRQEPIAHYIRVMGSWYRSARSQCWLCRFNYCVMVILVRFF